MVNHIRRIRWIAILLVIGLLLLPVVMEAANPVVTVTVQAWVVAAPSGFTLTYISDTEIQIDWVNSPAANATMIRAAYGHPPEDRTDGYEVYYGTNTTYTDDAIDLATPSIVHYRAWAENAGGDWTILYSSADTGGIMSQSFLFIGLLILGLVLFVAAFRWKDLLLSYSAALTWMAIGFWWILGDITNFDLEDPWSQILVFIPFILAFTVLLRLMNTEIRHEASGREGSTSWTTSGGTPAGRTTTPAQEYRKRLRKRLR